MKRPIFAIFLLVFLCLSVSSAAGQKKRATVRKSANAAAVKPTETGAWAVVMDETISVLRQTPSLYAMPVQRMRRGRRVQILENKSADGVTFFRVSAPPGYLGWVQADAVFGKFRPADEERLARLIQASSGFEQIDLAVSYFELYPDSKFRPAILLLFGDLADQVAAKLSKDAVSRLSRREMSATAAPEHSYFLNFVSLDRYRKLGIIFLFNGTTKRFHYDGTSWREIVKKYSSSNEAIEAQKRLDLLKEKMQAK